LVPVGLVACGTFDAVVVGLVGLGLVLLFAVSVGVRVWIGLLVGSSVGSELKVGWVDRVGTGEGNLSLLT